MLYPVDAITTRNEGGGRARFALDSKGELWTWRRAGRSTDNPREMSKWVHIPVTRTYGPNDNIQDDSRFVKFIYAGITEDLGFQSEAGNLFFQGEVPWKVFRATSFTERQ